MNLYEDSSCASERGEAAKSIFFDLVYEYILGVPVAWGEQTEYSDWGVCIVPILEFTFSGG